MAFNHQTRVPRIPLNRDDHFHVIRGLAFGGLKASRGDSGAFGGELAVTPSTPLADPPLRLAPQEIESLAARVILFFALDGGLAPGLAELPTLAEWAARIEAWWTAEPLQLTFFTSGSTGESKPVVRRYHDLEQDSHFLASMIPGGRRILTTAPSQHLYGFFYNLMVSRAMGIPWKDMRFETPMAVAEELRPGDVVVSMPFFWKLFAASVEAVGPGLQAVTSTAPCPRELAERLSAIGFEKVHEIYGSSESGIMASRNDPAGPFQLAPIWRRTERGTFIRPLPDGSDSEEFPFEDDLEFCGERSFRVLKRRDHAVQVGGINVYPERVANLLRAHEAVAECNVRLMRPEEGDRLKAFVVLRNHAAPTPEIERSLREHLASLSHFEQPKSIRFGARLPRNEIGKLADW